MAVATLKLDGLFFLLGAIFGIAVFAETLPVVEDFWLHGGAMGEFQLPEAFGAPRTWVVLGVVVMAIGVFVLVEKVERMFRKEEA